MFKYTSSFNNLMKNLVSKLFKEAKDRVVNNLILKSHVKETIPRLFLSSFLLGTSLFGLSCSKKSTDPEQQQEGNIVVNENTIPLTSGTLNNLISYENGIFTFSEVTPELEKVDSLDLIVGGISDETPKGFLRNVISVSEDGKTIKTSQASITDLIKKGEIEFSGDLSPDYLRVPTSGFEFSSSLDRVIYQGDGGEVSSSGKISFNYKPYLKIVIDNWQIQELIFTNTVSESLYLSINSSITKEIDKNVEFFHYFLQPIIVPIPSLFGPIPLVFTPEIIGEGNINGNLYGDITASVIQDFSLSVGVSYEEGKWNLIKNVDKSFGFDEPRYSGDALFTASVGPKLILYLYDAVGPSAGINGNLELDVDINRNPWYKLFVGLGAPIGVKAQIFGIPLIDYSTTIDFYRELLTQGPDIPLQANFEVTPDSFTMPSLVSFNASGSQGSNPIIKYKFIPGDGNQPLYETPENYYGSFDGIVPYLYNSPGTFFPNVTVTDDFGMTSSASDTVFAESSGSNNLTDPRDGQTYITVQIGNQIWMAENLNFNYSGSRYYNDDSVSYAEDYGRLYNWNASCNSCPPEWHLPSNVEFTELVNYLGWGPVAGGKLKEEGYEHWNPPNTGATNESGFTALPSGFGLSTRFYDRGKKTVLWSSTSAPDFQGHKMAYVRELYYDSERISSDNFSYERSFYLSVRCIKDQ